MPELVGLEEYSRDAFGSKGIFMVVYWHRSHSFNIQSTLVLMFIQESSNEASQAPVKMAPDLVLFGKGAYFFHRVDDAVRVVTVRAIKSDRVEINQGLHVLYIHLEFFIKSGFSELNVEVVSSFVDCRMDCYWNHPIFWKNYTLGLGFL